MMNQTIPILLSTETSSGACVSRAVHSRELPTVLTNYTSAKIGNKSWPNGRTIFGQIGELEKIICIFVVAIEVIQNGKSV